MPKLLFGVLLVLLPILSGLMAQTSGQNTWYTLLDKNGFTVQVAITNPKIANCRPGKGDFRFKYRKRGRNTSSTFLVWQIDFEDCDNKAYTKIVSFPIKFGESYPDWQLVESLDPSFAFTAGKLLSLPYNIRTSASPVNTVKKMAAQKSVVPIAVTGPDKVYFGEAASLSLTGGTLKPGSEWVWYEGRCGGNEIGRGTSIRFVPGQKTIVYVRAEGANDQTSCVSKILDVDRNSTPADGIGGATGICSGEATRLRVLGGHLGLDAQWVWYEGSCDGDIIGTGRELTVAPSGKTTYFVRAVGRYNTTDCREHTVEVSEAMISPEKIRADKLLVCEGETVELRVYSIVTDLSGNWYWTEGSCENKTLGIGASIKVKMQKTTTFFVKGVSSCNETACLSVTIEVMPKNYNPGVIKSDFKVYQGRETTLRIDPNPILGPDTRFLWFKNSCDNSPIGSGKSVVVKVRTPTTYFVKAITACNESDCKATRIFPLPAPRKSNEVPMNKFFVLGYAFGFAYKNFPAPIEVTAGLNPRFIRTEMLDNVGFSSELALHPIFTNWLGLGAHAGASFGTLPKTFLGSQPYDRLTYEYFEQKIGAEFFLGAPSVKILISQTLYLQDQDYRYESIQGNYQEVGNYEARLYRQIFSVGLRFGKSIGYRKKTMNLDILYTLTEQGADSFKFFKNPFESPTALQGLSVVLRTKNTPKVTLRVLLDPEKRLGGNKRYLDLSWNFINI